MPEVTDFQLAVYPANSHTNLNLYFRLGKIFDGTRVTGERKSLRCVGQILGKPTQLLALCRPCTLFNQIPRRLLRKHSVVS